MAGPTREEYIKLFSANIVPLRVVVGALTWVLYDYLLTLPDEVKYIWTQKRCMGRYMFFWIRYYTILLLVFDIIQIHSFAIPGVVNLHLCIAMDPTIRIVGAVSLWTVEIIMQMRIYALYGRSKKVAIINGALFILSIGFFLGITVFNTLLRQSRISLVMKSYKLPGCPVVNTDLQWAQWIPPTVFEFHLFVMAIYQRATSPTAGVRLNNRQSLSDFLMADSVLYFSIIACVLVFNNLMVVGATKIPWFSFAPFHASLGILTGRMLISLRKFSVHQLENDVPGGQFSGEGSPKPMHDLIFVTDLPADDIEDGRRHW